MVTQPDVARSIGLNLLCFRSDFENKAYEVFGFGVYLLYRSILHRLWPNFFIHKSNKKKYFGPKNNLVGFFGVFLSFCGKN